MKQKQLINSLLLFISMALWGTRMYAQEAYAVLTDIDEYGKKELTFYYDNQKAARNGMDIGPFSSALDRGWDSGKNNDVYKVVFDGSFANYSGLTSTAYWFYNCKHLQSIEGIENLKTDNVTDMTYMFCGEMPDLDVSKLNTSKVTTMKGMFCGCNKLTSLDVSKFDTSNVTDMSNMFNECEKLTSLDLSSFDTNNVTNMRQMFYKCGCLPSLDLSMLNTSKVTTMMWMFSWSGSLTHIDLSNFDTSNVTDMQGMFEGCQSMVSLDLRSFNTSKVTTMASMFCHCYNLISLDISTFDTSALRNISSMFGRCESLPIIDVSSFNTSNVKSMDHIFDNCYELTTIYGTNWDTSNLNHYTSNYTLFKDCKKLTGGKGTKYFFRNDNESYARIDGGESAPGYFTSKDPAGIIGKTDGKVFAAHSLYDLQGRRLQDKPSKGVYIQDGKKYLVK